MVIFSHSSFLADNTADTFSASLLILLYISSSNLIINSHKYFYVRSKMLSLKREESFDGRVVSIEKQIWFCSTFFITVHKVLKANI